MFFFVIMKKFGFKIVLLNLNLLSIEGTLMIFLLFRSRHHIKKFKIAMGSPIGPALANVFLCYHEKICLQNCPSEFKLVIYRR